MVVPDHILMRRKKEAVRKVRLLKEKENARKRNKAFLKKISAKASAYARKYRVEKNNEVSKVKMAKKTGDYYVKAEPKLAFVIRIRGIIGLAPKPRKVLQLLRLRQINNGVFVRLNKATINMLRIAEPNIAYGYPSVETVRKLVYKRGFAKIRGQRIPITDNKIIKKYLGRYGIICAEDLVHEIYSVGKHFKQATNFLWHFKLNNPKGGWRKKTNHYVEGGDFGDREDLINALVKRML